MVTHGHPPSARAVRRAERVAQIRTIFTQSRGLYGSPKITAVLRQRGERITQKTVAQLMRAAGLRSRVVKKSAPRGGESPQPPLCGRTVPSGVDDGYYVD